MIMRSSSSSSAPTRLKRIVRFILPPLGRISLTVVILTIVAVPSLLTYNSPPFQYNYNAMTIDYSNPFRPEDYYQPFDKDFNYSVLIDVHSHTDVGGGQISPETSIQWHIANGYNAFVVTDHNDVQRAFDTQQLAREKYADKIHVLVGEEWSNCRMHMGLIGLKEYVEVPKWPTDLQIQQVINNTHAQGGVVVVNHIPWSYYANLAMPSKEDLVKWGVDYFDVTTGQAFDLQTLYFARDNGVGIVAATDIHQIQTANEWTLLDVAPDNITEDSILAALRTRKTTIMFDFIGHYPPVKQTTPPENKEYIVAIPWLLVGQLFHSFYSRKDAGTYSFVTGFCNEQGDTPVWQFDETAILMSLAWLFIVWIILEIVFGLIKFAVKKLWGCYKRRNGRIYHGDDEYLSTETPLLNLWNK